MKVGRHRRGKGLELRLAPIEVDLLRELPEQLSGLYELPRGQDPAADRMFPPAYFDPSEVEAEAAYRDAVQPELRRERLGALDRLLGSLARAKPKRDDLVIDLSEEELDAWIGVLNDARLVLGVRLNLADDSSYEDLELGDDEEGAPMLMAYQWLTTLQGALVEAILGESF
jgi:hypothetical protein